MDEMEQKLGAILNNPEMMSQIMSMAQSFGKNTSDTAPTEPSKKDPSPPAKATTMPNSADLAMIQKVYGLAQNTNIDRNQQALLRALSPYLSKDRINKLEKAMRAAKLAGFATLALTRQG